MSQHQNTEGGSVRPKYSDILTLALDCLAVYCAAALGHAMSTSLADDQTSTADDRTHTTPGKQNHNWLEEKLL